MTIAQFQALKFVTVFGCFLAGTIELGAAGAKAVFSIQLQLCSTEEFLFGCRKVSTVGTKVTCASSKTNIRMPEVILACWRWTTN